VLPEATFGAEITGLADHMLQLAQQGEWTKLPPLSAQVQPLLTKMFASGADLEHEATAANARAIAHEVLRIVQAVENLAQERRVEVVSALQGRNKARGLKASYSGEVSAANFRTL
jgi:hypothetical protein